MTENITVTHPEHLKGMRGVIVDRPTGETANVRLANGQEMVLHTDNFTVDRGDRAFELGRQYGHNVGTWVIDGNTTTETMRRILQGYDDGDPEIMDMEPSPLSGEWADSPTPTTVYRDLGMSDEDVETDDPAGMLLTDYELGFSEGYWAEVTRAARAMLGIG